MKDFISHLRFDDYNVDQLLSCYKDDIKNNKKKITVTPNLDGMRITYKDDKLRRLINYEADYVTIDGKPIMWLSKFNKRTIFRNKISGSDLTMDVLKMANEMSLSLCLFGGSKESLLKASENISQKFPNITITNAISPKFGYEKSDELTDKYINLLNNSKANIYLLCTGFPKTEKFYFDNVDRLNCGLYFCVGATIDFLAGTIKRAPKRMSNVGLEWLYRLFKDFRRLFKRYWLDFCFLVKIFFINVFNKNIIEEKRKNEENINVH